MPETCKERLDRIEFGFSRADPSKWVPVGERLPEAGAVVLGFVLDTVRAVCYLAPDHFNEASWSLVPSGANIPVTHWQPLPDPPQATP